MRLNILVLFARPLVYEEKMPITLLDTEEERRQIRDVLKGCPVRVRFAPGTPENLQAGIADGYEILHFSGHGIEGKLCFEAEDGELFLVDSDMLRDLTLRGDKPAIRLIFLSACHSESVIDGLRDIGIPHIIAVDRSETVFDRAASVFCREFYRALSRGWSVSDAHKAGQTAIVSDPKLNRHFQQKHGNKYKQALSEESRKFRLISSNPKEIICEGREGEFIDDSKKMPETRVPSLGKQFIGRQREMVECIKSIRNNRVTTIRGDGGMGKTALAWEVSRWLREHYYFSGGHSEVRLEEASSKDEALLRFAAAFGVSEPDPEGVAIAEAIPKGSLVLIDGAESVLEHSPGFFRGFISKLATTTDGPTLLITSRDPIHPTQTPEKIIELHKMAQQDATDLFLSRTAPKQVDPSTLKELLEELDGLPTAIEIAAGMFRNTDLTLSKVLNFIKKADEPYEVLGVPESERTRTQSLRKCVKAQYEALKRLKEAECAREIIGILSQFPVGFSEEELNYISDGALERMRPLGYIPLVQEEKRRYYILNSVRSYTKAITESHSLPSPEWVIRALDRLKDGAESVGMLYVKAPIPLAIAIYSQGLPNWESARGWFSKLESDRRACESFWRIAFSLTQIANHLDRFSEHILWLEDGLKAARSISSKEGEANTLRALGDLSARKGEIAESERYYRDALPIYKDIEDRLGEANTLRALGDLSVRKDEIAESERYYRDALPIYKDIEARLGEANTLRALGRIAGMSDPLLGIRIMRAVRGIHISLEDRLGEQACLGYEASSGSLQRSLSVHS